MGKSRAEPFDRITERMILDEAAIFFSAQDDRSNPNFRGGPLLANPLTDEHRGDSTRVFEMGGIGAERAQNSVSLVAAFHKGERQNRVG